MSVQGKKGNFKEDFLRELQKGILTESNNNFTMFQTGEIRIKSLTKDVLRVASCYEDIDIFLSAAERCGIGDSWFETKYVFTTAIYRLLKEMNVTETHNIDVVVYEFLHFYVKLLREFDAPNGDKQFLLWVIYDNNKEEKKEEYTLNKIHITLSKMTQLDPPKITYSMNETTTERLENLFADTFYYAARIYHHILKPEMEKEAKGTPKNPYISRQDVEEWKEFNKTRETDVPEKDNAEDEAALEEPKPVTVFAVEDLEKAPSVSVSTGSTGKKRGRPRKYPIPEDNSR